MSNTNIVVITGRLVCDPIIRNDGYLRGVFSIACNHRYRDKTGMLHKETAFVPCKCFGNWTDTLARHKKGDMMIIEGRLRTETWNDSGKSRSQLVLVSDSVQFIGAESQPPAHSNDPGASESGTPAEDGSTGDKPPS